MRTQAGGGRNDLDEATRRQVLRQVASSLPIDDLLGWLLQTYPEADRDRIFALLRAIYQGEFKINPASENPRSYPIGDQVLRACPQRVEAG
jgi:hypothetical protein